MLSFLDIMERAMSGPIMPENDFLMNLLIPHIAQIVEEFGKVMSDNV